MPPSDNESSDDETDAFTTTNVLLGYASKEPTDDLFSQLGGYPTWLEPQDPPSAHLARCKICHRIMALMLQLNGDLPERFPAHDRRLYIFTCKSRTCRRKEGSVRAVRAVRAAVGVQLPEVAGSKQARSTSKELAGLQEDDSQRNKPSPQNLGNMIFNSGPQNQKFGNANPFSVSVSTSTFQASNPFSTSTQPKQPNPFNSQQAPSTLQSPPSNPPLTPSTLSETFAQKARLSSPPPPQSLPPREPWPPVSDLPPPYPSYHLDADFETLDAPHLPPSTSSARIMEIDDPPPSSTAGKGKDADADTDADAYESPSLDKTFRRFADRLAQNPMQVLRYEFGGLPLLYSKFDAVGKLFSSSSPTSSIINSSSNKKITTSTTPSSAKSGIRIPYCENCAAPRVFELQLTPQAIGELEAEDEMSLEGMDWGSVILGVCSRDCVPRGVQGALEGVGRRVGGKVEQGEGGKARAKMEKGEEMAEDGKNKVKYAEEWVGVQWEELGGGRR